MLKKILLISAISLSVSACAMKTTHFINNENGHNLSQTEAVTNDSDYFIGGIFQSKNINAETACGDSKNVVAVQTFRSATNFVIGLITFGIYSPQEETVFCKK